MESSTPRLSTPRPSTPPPRTGLLTPPSTGGSRKRVLFVEPQESNKISKRQNKSQVHEGETLSEFFEDSKEGLDIEVDIESTASASPTEGSSVTSDTEISVRASPLSEAPYKSDCKAAVADSVLGFSNSYDVATCVTLEAFPFMKLPLIIRNRVYEYILLVPAIICVRQKHTAYHDERKAFLYAERRELLPGIAYALAQTKVDGFKTRFSRFPSINLNILRTSKEVFMEARAIMYSKCEFEIVKPTDELTPQPDFSIPLFPPGYQRIVTKLNIRIRTFYDLHWLLSGGYNAIRKYYRGLSTLTLILEMDSATKGFGRQWARKESESWVAYIKRLQGQLAGDLFRGAESKNTTIPTCLNLRVLFSGETYDGNSSALTNTTGIAMTDSIKVERVKREELRSALVETWGLFKNGGR
jgi:hypothetical protein